MYQTPALERLLERVIPYTVAPEGGGQTVVDGTEEGLTTDALSSDVEAALYCLVSKLEAVAGRGTGALQGDGILLDVEIGDVRLLALRRGRPSSMSLLSPREQEIARMVARGYANKTIASVLEISSWTVASHLRRIFVKLGVSSRAAMVTCLSGMGSGQFPALLDDVIDDGVTPGPRPPQMETISRGPGGEISTATRL
jgi:DNA-binding CsgD family transcriptional regulator